MSAASFLAPDRTGDINVPLSQLQHYESASRFAHAGAQPSMLSMAGGLAAAAATARDAGLPAAPSGAPPAGSVFASTHSSDTTPGRGFASSLGLTRTLQPVAAAAALANEETALQQLHLHLGPLPAMDEAGKVKPHPAFAAFAQGRDVFPIHAATEAGHPLVVTALLAYGSDPTALDPFDQTAADIAAQRQFRGGSSTADLYQRVLAVLEDWQSLPQRQRLYADASANLARVLEAGNPPPQPPPPASTDAAASVPSVLPPTNKMLSPVAEVLSPTSTAETERAHGGLFTDVPRAAPPGGVASAHVHARSGGGGDAGAGEGVDEVSTRSVLPLQTPLTRAVSAPGSPAAAVNDAAVAAPLYMSGNVALPIPVVFPTVPSLSLSTTPLASTTVASFGVMADADSARHSSSVNAPPFGTLAHAGCNGVEASVNGGGMASARPPVPSAPSRLNDVRGGGGSSTSRRHAILAPIVVSGGGGSSMGGLIPGMDATFTGSTPLPVPAILPSPMMFNVLSPFGEMLPPHGLEGGLMPPPIRVRTRSASSTPRPGAAGVVMVSGASGSDMSAPAQLMRSVTSGTTPRSSMTPSSATPSDTEAMLAGMGPASRSSMASARRQPSWGAHSQRGLVVTPVSSTRSGGGGGGGGGGSSSIRSRRELTGGSMTDRSTTSEDGCGMVNIVSRSVSLASSSPLADVVTGLHADTSAAADAGVGGDEGTSDTLSGTHPAPAGAEAGRVPHVLSTRLRVVSSPTVGDVGGMSESDVTSVTTPIGMARMHTRSGTMSGAGKSSDTMTRMYSLGDLMTTPTMTPVASTDTLVSVSSFSLKSAASPTRDRALERRPSVSVMAGTSTNGASVHDTSTGGAAVLQQVGSPKRRRSSETAAAATTTGGGGGGVSRAAAAALPPPPPVSKPAAARVQAAMGINDMPAVGNATPQPGVMQTSTNAEIDATAAAAASVAPAAARKPKRSSGRGKALFTPTIQPQSKLEGEDPSEALMRLLSPVSSYAAKQPSWAASDLVTILRADSTPSSVTQELLKKQRASTSNSTLLMTLGSEGGLSYVGADESRTMEDARVPGARDTLLHGRAGSGEPIRVSSHPQCCIIM